MVKREFSDHFPYINTHGGDIYRNRADLDFSVSLNPLGMPEEISEALKEAVPSWSSYPDPFCTALRGELCSHLGVEQDTLIFGNGAAELIYDLVRAKRPQKALILAPGFSEYEKALRAADCEINLFRLSEDEDFGISPSALAAAIDDKTDLVFLCNPNNPTGRSLKRGEVREIEKACHDRQALLCVDETFVELLADPSGYSVISDCALNPYLCVIRAFTKTYALAGLRLGYLISSDKDLLERMALGRQPWNVSAPAQCAGLAALTKVPDTYLDTARDLIISERARVSAELKKMGYDPIPGNANFILFHSPSTDLFEKCLRQGILIRDCRSFAGLAPGYYRIGLRTREENDKLIHVLAKG